MHISSQTVNRCIIFCLAGLTIQYSKDNQRVAAIYQRYFRQIEHRYTQLRDIVYACESSVVIGSLQAISSQLFNMIFRFKNYCLAKQLHKFPIWKDITVEGDRALHEIISDSHTQGDGHFLNLTIASRDPVIKTTISAAIKDIHTRGIPKELLEKVRRYCILTVKRPGMLSMGDSSIPDGCYEAAYKRILLNNSLVVSASDNVSSRKRLQVVLAHELGHVLDYHLTQGLSYYSDQTIGARIVFNEDKDSFEVQGEAILGDILDMYHTDKTMASVLDYPLHEIKQKLRFLEYKKDKISIVSLRELSQCLNSEIFAQIHMLYYLSGNYLNRVSPEVYNFMHKAIESFRNLSPISTKHDLIEEIRSNSEAIVLDLSKYSELVDDEVLEAVGKLKQLRKLDLTRCHKVTDKGLQNLKFLTGMNKLILDDCSQLTDITLESLIPLRNLSELRCSQCLKITDAGLLHISKIKSLKRLYLEECVDLTEGGISHLSGLDGLVELYLDGCYKLNDAAMESIGKLTCLKALYIKDCSKITDRGIDFLSNIPLLKELSLWGCSEITDGVFSFMQHLSQLRELNLKGCSKIVGRGLENLKIRWLNIEDCPNLERKHLPKSLVRVVG